MLHVLLKGYKLILGSQSPRRSQLLASLDVSFEKRVKEVDESILPEWKPEEVAQKLAERKALAQQSSLNTAEILLTSDTTVVLGSEILNKPQDKSDAIRMLKLLSGKVHQVITGVCIATKSKTRSFKDATLVKFKSLNYSEIAYYVNTHQPYDKAGAYGIQEWIGMIGIEHIEGSYFTVMGLPVHMIYSEMNELIENQKNDN